MGGGEFFLGSLKISLFLIDFFKIYIRMIANENPNKGDNKRACPISMTLSQLMEEVPILAFSGSKAWPTPIPIIDPIRVWELESRDTKIPGA
jgi:hypothetical protein